MTWYASHIYARPTEPVVSELLSHPVLSRGLYLLKDLRDYRWPELKDIKIEHGLPEDGLLVVRELCAPNTDEAHWHDDRREVPASISWLGIEGATNVEIILPPHLPTYGFGQIHLDDNPEAYPPVPFLCYLKHLSRATNTTIAYYHHMSAAGYGVQQEFAWVFGSEECVYVDNVGRSLTLTKYTWEGVIEIPQKLSSDSILKYTLLHFDLDLPSSFFAPHTRDFKWSRYKLE